MIQIPALPLTGECSCGATRYRVGGRPLTCYTCHCRECQQQSGSAFGMSLIVPLEGFTVDGPTAFHRRTAPSGFTSRCHFCTACGTRIFHAREGGDRAALKPGTLDERDWLRPIAHIWTSEAQPWVQFADGLPTVAGQPDMPALFALWQQATA